MCRRRRYRSDENRAGIPLPCGAECRRGALRTGGTGALPRRAGRYVTVHNTAQGQVIVTAIDPGNERSAVLRYDARSGRICGAEILSNVDVLRALYRDDSSDHLVVEMVQHYGTGMPVGRTVFETCVWIGRFIEAWGRPFTLLPRREVKLHLCGSARARDSNVRQALLDRFPATGGGKFPQVGTKRQPGPLYGIKRDLWAALAVAVTWIERRRKQAR